MFAKLRRDLPRVVWASFVLVAWVGAAFVLSGCSLLAPKVGAELAELTDRYCELPHTERDLVRSQLNREIAPHRLELQCSGDDPAPTAGPISFTTLELELGALLDTLADEEPRPPLRL